MHMALSANPNRPGSSQRPMIAPRFIRSDAHGSHCFGRGSGIFATRPTEGFGSARLPSLGRQARH